MKKFLSIIILATLAACSEPAAEPAPVEAQAAPAPVEPSLPAPNLEIFATAFGAACPDAETVNTAVCKRAGVGSENVICDYGLGDDEHLRNTATLTAGDGAWIIADPETVCAQGA